VSSIPIFYENPYRVCWILEGSGAGSSHRNLRELLFNVVFGLQQVLKGLIHPADARRAVEAGVDGVVATTPPRDSEPQKLCLGPKKYSLWRFPIENIYGPR
jgi:hypothetical protein